MDIGYVCELTERHRYGGRVAVGHVTKLSLLPPDGWNPSCGGWRKPASRDRAAVDRSVPDGTRPAPQRDPRRASRARAAARRGQLPLSTNNVLNPFTPFGDCSLVRMANLYANVCHVGTPEDLRECSRDGTERSARLMRIESYGIAAGKAADLVVLDCRTPDGGRRAVRAAPRIQAGTQDIYPRAGRTPPASALDPAHAGAWARSQVVSATRAARDARHPPATLDRARSLAKVLTIVF